MPTSEEILAMADRLEARPDRPMMTATAGSARITTPSMSTFSQDDADRKAAAIMLREIAGEREAPKPAMYFPVSGGNNHISGNTIINRNRAK